MSTKKSVISNEVKKQVQNAIPQSLSRLVPKSDLLIDPESSYIFDNSFKIGGLKAESEPIDYTITTYDSDVGLYYDYRENHVKNLPNQIVEVFAHELRKKTTFERITVIKYVLRPKPEPKTCDKNVPILKICDENVPILKIYDKIRHNPINIYRKRENEKKKKMTEFDIVLDLYFNRKKYILSRLKNKFYRDVFGDKPKKVQIYVGNYDLDQFIYNEQSNIRSNVVNTNDIYLAKVLLTKKNLDDLREKATAKPLNADSMDEMYKKLNYLHSYEETSTDLKNYIRDLESKSIYQQMLLLEDSKTKIFKSVLNQPKS